MGLGESKAAAPLLLTKEERTALKQQWKQLHHADQPGRSILESIFSKSQHIRDVFGFATLPNPRFNSHAQRFNDIFSLLIASLNALPNSATVKQQLEHLGGSHVQFQGAGFKEEYFQVFRDSMVETLCRDGLNLDAWTKLIDYLITTMREGFAKENRT